MKPLGMGLWLIIFLAAAARGEQNNAVWVGHRFSPEQLVALRSGEATFARKLCTIHYHIRRQDDHFTVQGRLEFNPRFVPRRPRAIDLEILLVNAQHMCTGQINQHHAVTADEVPFAFQVPATPPNHFVRTYYTRHY